MTYTFQSRADEKEMVKAILDAPIVVVLPDHFDLYVGVADEHRIEVIDWLNAHKINHQSFTCYVRVIDKPSRLYKCLGGLVQRFPFFIFI